MLNEPVSSLFAFKDNVRASYEKYFKTAPKTLLAQEAAIG